MPGNGVGEPPVRRAHPRVHRQLQPAAVRAPGEAAGGHPGPVRGRRRGGDRGPRHGGVAGADGERAPPPAVLLPHGHAGAAASGHAAQDRAAHADKPAPLGNVQEPGALRSVPVRGRRPARDPRPRCRVSGGRAALVRRRDGHLGALLALLHAV
eukprot:scaffold1220_cov259-Pinguiococcus_pyrenoidosus.AAC.78